MIKFSIVIPIYNTESTIERCVDSVLKQTYRNVEIILVDDGSTDGSGAICDYYSQYGLVKVVHKVNGGLSSARNTGIAEASGEYLLFLDADDFLENNVCDSLNEAIITGGYPDCIDFGIKYVNSNNEDFINVNKLEKNSRFNKDYLLNFIIPSLLKIKDDSNHNIWEFVWNKSFKLDIIRKFDIRFDESRRIWEDKPFLLNYLRFCNSYYSLDNCFYYYVNTVGSLSGRYDMQFFDIILANYYEYKEWYGDRYDFDTPYVNGYWCRSIEQMIFRSLEQSENKETIENNIISTLYNDTVKEWYKKRNPESKEEKKANELMNLGDVQAVLDFYKTCFINRQVSDNKKNSFLQKGKNVFKRILNI